MIVPHNKSRCRQIQSLFLGILLYNTSPSSVNTSMLTKYGLDVFIILYAMLFYNKKKRFKNVFPMSLLAIILCIHNLWSTIKAYMAGSCFISSTSCVFNIYMIDPGQVSRVGSKPIYRNILGEYEIPLLWIQQLV